MAPDDRWFPVLLLGALAACGLLALAAAAQLAAMADRADNSADLAEAAAWQVSQILENARRITAEAAEQRARGELGPP